MDENIWSNDLDSDLFSGQVYELGQDPPRLAPAICGYVQCVDNICYNW